MALLTGYTKLVYRRDRLDVTCIYFTQEYSNPVCNSLSIITVHCQFVNLISIHAWYTPFPYDMMFTNNGKYIIRKFALPSIYGRFMAYNVVMPLRCTRTFDLC